MVRNQVKNGEEIKLECKDEVKEECEDEQGLGVKVACCKEEVKEEPTVKAEVKQERLVKVKMEKQTCIKKERKRPVKHGSARAIEVKSEVNWEIS